MWLLAPLASAVSRSESQHTTEPSPMLVQSAIALPLLEFTSCAARDVG
jgi:hypothetical protein